MGLNIIYLVIVNYVIVVSKLFLMNLLAKFLIVKVMNVFSLDFVKKNVYIIDMLNLDCTTKCLNAFDEYS